MTGHDQRWPVQPLLDAGYKQRDIRKSIGLNDRPCWDKAVTHGLTDRQADRACIRLRTFPHHIWPDWVDAGLTVLDRDYLNGGWRQAWLWQETR